MQNKHLKKSQNKKFVAKNRLPLHTNDRVYPSFNNASHSVCSCKEVCRTLMLQYQLEHS